MEEYIEPYFVFHLNQYRFVANGVCKRALFTFSKTVDYFLNNRNNVYIYSLNACKAFDRVNYFALFAAMLQRDCMPKNLINTFMS